MTGGYLQFGEWGGPYQTVRVGPANLCVTPAPYNRSRTGYGSRIPTCRMVRYNGRWRRVYVACYGNSGTAYVNIGGKQIVYDEDMA